jgi:dihydroflavonol-4-reductase
VKAFVTGASGFVGWHVARALVERGDSVRCLVRGDATPASLALSVEIVHGDLRDAGAVRRGVEGADVVYHCAADYRLWVPDPATMAACNVDGTRHVLEAAAACGVRRVVYTSTVGALGLRSDGLPADETTPAAVEDMIGPYKRSKFLAEREAERWAARGLPVVIVNPSAPVGERDVKPTATGRIVLDFLRGGMRAYVDTGLNLVDVRDVAAGHLLAAERGRPGERYILGHENVTLKDMLDILARVSGVPAPKVRLPHWVPLAAAWVESGLARVGRREPRIALDAVRLARHRMWFDPSKAVRELGLPQTPVESALARAVAWFREQRVRERTAA